MIHTRRPSDSPGFLTTAFAAGGVAVLTWWIAQLDLGYRRQPPAAERDTPASLAEEAVTNAAMDVSVEDLLTDELSQAGALGDGDAGASPKAEAIVLLPNTSAEMTSRRWDNPFQAEYWLSDGWVFAADAMQTTGTSDASALFRRAFRRLVVECALRPANVIPDQSAGPTDTSASDERFEFRFVTYRADGPTGQRTEHQTMIELTRNGFDVSADGPRGVRPIEHRDISLSWSKDEPGVVRIAATGNRIVIVWNGRRVLACNQPVSQSGQPCFVGLQARTPGWRIERLRIEGE